MSIPAPGAAELDAALEALNLIAARVAEGRQSFDRSADGLLGHRPDELVRNWNLARQGLPHESIAPTTEEEA